MLLSSLVMVFFFFIIIMIPWHAMVVDTSCLFPHVDNLYLLFLGRQNLHSHLLLTFELHPQHRRVWLARWIVSAPWQWRGHDCVPSPWDGVTSPDGWWTRRLPFWPPYLLHFFIAEWSLSCQLKEKNMDFAFRKVDLVVFSNYPCAKSSIMDFFGLYFVYVTK